jgi:hypothetical protein
MTPENLTADTRLTRRQLAERLTAEGFPISPATLATKATRGGGPKFQRFGRIPLYRWGDALQWAQSRLTKLVATTSELDAARGTSTASAATAQPRRQRKITSATVTP